MTYYFKKIFHCTSLMSLMTMTTMQDFGASVTSKLLDDNSTVERRLGAKGVICKFLRGGSGGI
jgi:hypothetical protein